MTLKWDGENRYMALKNGDGKWGVFDTEANAMVTDYAYDNMSAVYGDYAKVYNGTAWGRLDLSGATATAYVYDAEDAFSVKEELRSVGDGQWQVFNADNEPISVVYDGSWATVSYAAQPHLMMAEQNGGVTVLYDLSGTAVATFDASKNVRYLQGLCYAVEAYEASGALTGTALGVAEATVQPDDTVLAGDVNLDGTADSADVRLMLRYAAGLTTLTARQTAAGDVYADGRLNSTDARVLLWQTTQMP
ncbi:MAG: dockerin type I repeat-containing protein [Clostridia bacterium]|nr:dockerin type I repeat-containing protein [Clostridia bacterium]